MNEREKSERVQTLAAQVASASAAHKEAKGRLDAVVGEVARRGLSGKRAMSKDAGRQLAALRDLRENLLAQLKDQAVALVERSHQFQGYVRAASITTRLLEELSTNAEGEEKLLRDMLASHTRSLN